MTITSGFADMMSSLIFLCCFVSLVSYWSKFYLNIITMWVMTIYFYNGLTRNPEFENTPVWVLRNIWRLESVRNTKPGTDVSNKMLLNATKCQSYSFYRFLVIKGKPKGRGGLKLSHLDFLINLCFQGVNRLFIISFKNNGGRASCTRYYLPLVETKNYNVMIDGRNFFDQPVKDNLIT